MEHGHGFTTAYAHNKENYVKVGQKVKRGEVIGISGSTGTTTGPHLHYEVWKNGGHVDPAPFLKGYALMFWKKDQQALEVVIGPESGIKGDLTTKGVVKLDGAIDGCVSADWVIVGETGKITGDVASRGTVIYGTVEGNIKSSELIEIKSKAVVEGDIYTTKLVVSEGAFFDGRSYMQRRSGSDVVSLEQKAKKVRFGVDPV